MQIDRPIINVDLDHVLYPFTEVLGDFISFHGRRLPWMRKDPSMKEEWEGPKWTYRPPDAEWVHTRWEIWEDWDMSEGAWRHWFRKAVQDRVLWWTGDPYEGAMDALWRLSDDEYHIRIVTNRLVHKFDHKLAVEATAHWLDEHRIPYRDLAFTSKKNIGGALLIDDNRQNLESFAGMRVVMSQPWNQDWPLAPPRADDWMEAEELIRALVPRAVTVQD